MISEKKLYQFAYNWATHIWYKLDLYIRENPDNCKYVQIEEKIAKEKGYNL